MVRHSGASSEGEDMSRFFVETSDIQGNNIYITDKNDIHHIKKVLRLKPGSEVDISDKMDWEYRAEIEKIQDEQVVLLILDKQKFAREPETKITLYQGIPKGGKMEEIIQKSVELGVYSIVPVFMDRTVVVDKGNFAKKMNRWQKISDEAVKQCRRGIIPQVEEPVDFEQAVDRLANYDVVVFPYENEENRTIKDCLKNYLSMRRGNSAEAAVIIGPEGGFSQKEAEMLAEQNILSVSLGKTILRTETAGPATIAMIMYELEL